MSVNRAIYGEYSADLLKNLWNNFLRSSLKFHKSRFFITRSCMTDKGRFLSGLCLLCKGAWVQTIFVLGCILPGTIFSTLEIKIKDSIMNLRLLLFLFLLVVFLTISFTVLLKNRGPWNNPMFFFMTVFMTSWTLSLWLNGVVVKGTPNSYLSVTLIAVLTALMLAGSTVSRKSREKIRRVRDKKLVEVVTRHLDPGERILPNIYYWILLSTESVLIIAGYYLINLEVLH
jgi:hypothetical protein